MGIPKITLNRQQGLGRFPDGEDYISGLLLYSDTLPAGFTTSERVKKIPLETCIHCGKTLRKNQITRYHNDKCKYKDQTGRFVNPKMFSLT